MQAVTINIRTPDGVTQYRFMCQSGDNMDITIPFDWQLAQSGANGVRFSNYSDDQLLDELCRRDIIKSRGLKP